MPNEGDIVKILVHALFKCPKCGKMHPRLSVAPVVVEEPFGELRVVGPADPADNPVCPDCTGGERKAGERRRRWKPKLVGMGKGVGK